MDTSYLANQALIAADYLIKQTTSFEILVESTDCLNGKPGIIALNGENLHIIKVISHETTDIETPFEPLIVDEQAVKQDIDDAIIATRENSISLSGRDIVFDAIELSVIGGSNALVRSTWNLYGGEEEPIADTEFEKRFAEQANGMLERGEDIPVGAVKPSEDKQPEFTGRFC